MVSKYIASIKPKEYLKQGLSHCGVYSVKAILSAYGKDNKVHPKEYHTNWIGRNLFSFATGEKYYNNILASYGIKSETKSAEDLSDKEKIELLKNILSKDTPVMIRIGNGYFPDKKYNPIIGKLMPHWITLWGYDDNKQLFYVYDSGLPVKFWDKSLPVGNTKRTHDEIIRDWNFGRLQPWCWNTSSRNNLYVEIIKD
jgi:hypothetical protein